MARIRTIKPEFFTSEDIVSLSPLARLLYIALWCESDKEGRLAWKPMTFKLRYLPAESCEIDALCGEVINGGLVVLYGNGLAHIPQFRKHQHINPRETESQLPAPHDALPTRASRVTTRHSPDSDAQGGREGKGKERDISPEPFGPEPDPSGFAIPLNDGSEWAIPLTTVQDWKQAFPAVDVDQELREMRAWANANPTKRKTSRGVSAFAFRWLAKAQDTPSRAKASANASDWTRVAL